MKDVTAALLDDSGEHRCHFESSLVIFGIGFVGQNDGVGHFCGQCFDHAKRSIEKFNDEIFELRCGQTHFFFNLDEKAARSTSISRRSVSYFSEIIANGHC